MRDEAELGSITRRAVEQLAGRMLADEEWTDLRSEIIGRVDNFVNELVNDLVEDLEEVE